MFSEKLKTYSQYLIPQHTLSRFMSLLGNCPWPWFKNAMIQFFIQRYQVDMSTALEPDAKKYATFNDFFTRRLNPNARPIVSDPQAIACPADGFVSEMGQIEQEQIFQAKGHYFSLQQLLGGSAETTALFRNGAFATLYLAPKNYHRFHMPLGGMLKEMTYVPGKLFSVSPLAAREIPSLFARNERVITLFDTAAGPMAVILVGAMIVGSIQTVWAGTVAPSQHRTVTRTSYVNSHIKLDRGQELGAFKMGSTVIVLFAKDRIAWNPLLTATTEIKMGQSLGTIKQGIQRG